MKLLIDLDEKYINAIDKIKFLVGGRTDRKLQLEVIKAIKNGKALEQEPATKNDDCISREFIYCRIKGMEHYEESEGSEGDWITYNTCDWNEVLREIEDAPSVTPQEPKTGHWIKRHDNVGWWYVCDKCGSTPLWDENTREVVLSPYCPNCGADMRGEE